MADRKRTELDWQDLRTFLFLGRHGSLSAAARALGVNHATIARRIHALEANLGDKLVERRPDGYILTPAGADVLAAASVMEEAALKLGRRASDGTPKGLVRINAPPALAQGFLVARLAELALRYRGLDIDLATDVQAISLERHQADIAIRLSRPDDGDVIAKPLLAIGYGFYGTPHACQRIEDGAEPVFTGFGEAQAHVPEAIWLMRIFPRTRLSFRAANQLSQATAAHSGACIALLPHYIGRMDSLLRPCRLEPAPPSRDAFLLTRRRDRQDVTVRAVVEHVADAFLAERALFE